MSEHKYLLAQESWAQEGALVIVDQSQQQLLVIPLKFMRDGHLRTFAYVYEQIEYCFEQSGHLTTSVTDAGHVLQGDEVRAGRYIFVRSGKCSFRSCCPMRLRQNQMDLWLLVLPGWGLASSISTGPLQKAQTPVL